MHGDGDFKNLEKYLFLFYFLKKKKSFNPIQLSTKPTEFCRFWHTDSQVCIQGRINVYKEGRERVKKRNTDYLFCLSPSLVYWPSLVVQTVKNLPAMQETLVQSLGREDPLEKGMATHSSILAWRIPWTEQPGGLQSVGSQRIRHD